MELRAYPPEDRPGRVGRRPALAAPSRSCSFQTTASHGAAVISAQVVVRHAEQDVRGTAPSARTVPSNSKRIPLAAPDPLDLAGPVRLRPPPAGRATASRRTAVPLDLDPDDDVRHAPAAECCRKGAAGLSIGVRPRRRRWSTTVSGVILCMVRRAFPRGQVVARRGASRSSSGRLHRPSYPPATLVREQIGVTPFERATPMPLRFVAVALLGLAGVAAGEEPRLNQIQVIGTHNSYHIAPHPNVLGLIAAGGKGRAEGLEYAHRPLGEQFDRGIRQIELDLFADPRGGHYAEPSRDRSSRRWARTPAPTSTPDSASLVRRSSTSRTSTTARRPRPSSKQYARN